MKILIVEAETTKQRQLRTILSSLGHKSGEIESATDNRTAISSIRKKRFDIAFVSMSATGEEALEFIKSVRSGGSSKSLPLVAYSSEVSKENVVASHEAGANGFLAYPFSVSDVEGVLIRATKKGPQ